MQKNLERSGSQMMIKKLIEEKKKDKDILAVKNIIQHIYDNSSERKRFTDIYSSLPTKAKKSIDRTATANKIRLPAIMQAAKHERQ